MPNNLEFTVTGLHELLGALAHFPVQYTSGARALLAKIGFLVQAEAQKRTPSGSFNTVKYSTGNLRRSEATLLMDYKSPPTFVEVGTAMPYGPFIEFGERKGKSGKIIKRSLGPARMFKEGGKAAIPGIRALVLAFARKLLDDIKRAA